VHPNAEVEIQPDDAADLGIKENDVVRIVSEIGSLEIPAKIVSKSELRRGVIEIYHGWEEWRVNFVTHDNINDPISGFPLLKGIPVRIEPL
jgi:anaerobic selenocysteine-containing dehydrogenase